MSVLGREGRFWGDFWREKFRAGRVWRKQSLAGRLRAGSGKEVVKNRVQTASFWVPNRSGLVRGRRETENMKHEERARGGGAGG